MRIQDIGRTIARRRRAFPLAPAAFRGALALALLATAACRGGCGAKTDPAATVQGRLALFPLPTRVLVSLDFAQVRQSGAAAKLAALAKQSPDDERELRAFAARTGLDPVTQIDSLLVGFPEDARDKGELGLVLRAQALDEPRLVAYVRDQLQKQGDDLVGTPRGRFTLWAARNKPDVAGFFADAHTFVLGAGGWAPRMADLAATARPADSAATNIDLQRLVERAGAHALWAVALVPAQSRRVLAADPRFASASTIASLVAGVDLGQGLDAIVVGETATAGDARALATTMQETLRDAKQNAQLLMLGLGPYLDGVTARADERRFELKARLTEPQVDDLLSRLGAFLALVRQGRAPGFP